MKRSAMIGGAAVLCCAAAYGQFEIPWFTVDGGGAVATAGGGYELSGTIGQPDAGVMSGGSYTLRGGFWVGGGAPPAACGCGDVDQSGFVDLLDFTTLATCFGLQAPAPGCAAEVFFCADLNGDGAVNLLDFSLFSNAFGLPAQNSPPNCK